MTGRQSSWRPLATALTLFLYGAAFGAISVPAAAHDLATVVVGSKIDTEGALLGNLIALSLARIGLRVEDRIQLGPTTIVRRAITSAQIDIYPEYTGNGALFFHREGDPAWRDPDRGYAMVKALDAADGLVWLAPAPANNGWAIAVRGDLARAEGLADLDDFARLIGRGGEVRLAASIEFVESPGALPAFERAYGFRLGADQLLTLAGGNTSATIRAAAEHLSGVNAAMAYGTDGALAVLGLVLLADPRHAQLVYRPAPVVRAEVLGRYPQIADALAPVFASLRQTTLQTLNARIAVDGEDPRAVAAQYLASIGGRR